MADEYTPTTGQVRNRYASGRRILDARDACLTPVGELDAEFDRWLAAHDAEIRRDEREKVARELREALNRHPKVCDRYEEDDVISCGWKNAVRDFTNTIARIARGGGGS